MFHQPATTDVQELRSTDMMMNRAFPPSLVRPNLPLRRPATSPGLATIRQLSPVSNDLEPSLPQEEPRTNDSLDVFTAEANEKDTVAVKVNGASGSLVAPVIVKLCNYCSQQGNLKCTRCKKTCYCSAACQSEDWKAHRHICKPCPPENSSSEKSKECLNTPWRSGPSVFEDKVNKPKRVFLCDLRNNSISKGDELQGVVVELRNPGKFFIHIQSVENTETLSAITLDLQKMYSSSNPMEYKPHVEEVCAVKFSLDQNWYRGKVESVDLEHSIAKILYIDFGNEEDVTFGNIRALAESIDPAPPCALQCCVAGVKAVTSIWTGECSFVLRQLVAGKNITFIVKDTMDGGKIFAVDAPLSTLGKNLSSYLIDQGYAIEEGPTKPNTEQDINSLMIASFENFKRLSFGKNENIEAQPPEPLTQGVGDIFTAIVTHLQSPSVIICQKLENASTIQQLQLSLREHCTRTPASENFRPAPGTVCCALFSEDNQWYRVKVLGYSSEEKVCVGYIDFGNSEEVKLSHLRTISVELLTLAAQAIPCTLAGIKPTSDTWSEEVTLMLKRLVCNRFIQVEILGRQDAMALVSIVDESSDPQTNVAEVLVTTGYAAFEKETAKHIAKEVVLENPAADKLEWSCAELPFDGQVVVLVISVLENPGEFYCYNYKEKGMQILEELSSALMKHCKTDKTPFSPIVGEPCCALFSGDCCWYRGIVQSVEDNGKARVYFADYGNTCEVEVTHLRAINPVLLKHPFQAIRCCLAGVEPVGGHWKQTTVQRFRALCVGNRLSGKVLSITERGYGVELKYNGQDIASVLVSEQLVKRSGQENGPAPQENQMKNLKDASPIQMPMLTERPSNTEQPVKVTRQGAVPTQSSLSNASFPLNWKTVELPCGETFQPQIAAVISPSLFYVLNRKPMNMDVLQAVMTDVMKYCSRQALTNKSIPLPGAACCAQFSGDKNWYRAVVLDAASTHANVLYADYGNCERVPLSSILPIPEELLQPSFQIARCALSGKEHFPTVWPPEVLELFGAQLSGKVLTSVQRFDGSFNLLMFTQPLDQGGSSINSIILGALHKVPAKACTEELTLETKACNQGGPQDGSASITMGHTSTKTEKPKPGKLDMEKTSVMTSVENKELQAISGSKGISSDLVSSCCCDVLKQKMDRIEELILLVLKHTEGNQK